MDPRHQSTQLLKQIQQKNARGISVSALEYLKASKETPVSMLDELEIAAYKQMVTVDRFLLGILSGIIIGSGILAITLLSLGTIPLDFSTLMTDNGAVMGMFFLGSVFGSVFSWRFNRRSTRCPEKQNEERANYAGEMGPVTDAARPGQTCLNDWQCTLLSEKGLSNNDWTRNVQGRCAPVSPPKSFLFIRRVFAFAALVGGIVLMALYGKNIGTVSKSGTLLVGTVIGMFTGWMVGFLFS